MLPFSRNRATIVMVTITKGITLSIRDAINAAAQKNPPAQQQFLDWLDDQTAEDRQAIDAALVNGTINTRHLADVLKDHGAPITGNRLYDYRRSLMPKRVQG